MAKQRFRISKFRNPSGQEAYRVSGTLHGKRIRENFQTRPEALETHQQSEVHFLGVVRLLKHAGSSKSLSFAVEFFLQHYREFADQMSLKNAARDYLDERLARPPLMLRFPS